MAQQQDTIWVAYIALQIASQLLLSDQAALLWCSRPLLLCQWPLLLDAKLPYATTPT